MTVSEALKKHKEDCLSCRDKACKLNHECLQQKDIEVYEKLMKYEVIGTVEDIEKGIRQSEEEFDMLMEYRKIGTIEEFKNLKEKNVAKKPIRIDECTCPSCGTHNEIIKKRRNTVAFDTVYCWYCGQAIEVKRD